MWLTICHAEQGRVHIANNIPCQDKALSNAKNNVNVIALSDGAGSAKLSHFGAEAAITAISEFLCERFDEIYQNQDADSVCKEVVYILTERLNILSAELQCGINDLACTLLVVAVKEDNYILMHCGDGVIGYMSGDELMVATNPLNGEFANETVFVTSHTAQKNMRVAKGKLGDIRAFVLMSDGSEASLYSKRENRLAKAVGKIIDGATYLPVDQLRCTVAQLFADAVVKKTYDDCSIAFLVKRDSFTSKYHSLSLEEKCRLLQINRNANNVKCSLAKLETLLDEMQTPAALEEISATTGIKTLPYLKKKLNKLVEAQLVSYNDGKYCAEIQV